MQTILEALAVAIATGEENPVQTAIDNAVLFYGESADNAEKIIMRAVRMMGIQTTNQNQEG